MDQIALVFDGTIEGFLNIVYAYYYKKYRPVSICNDDGYQKALGFEYLYIDTDFKKSDRVMDAIQKKISPKAWEYVYGAFLTSDQTQDMPLTKYMEIFRYILLGFRVGKTVDSYETEEYVLKVHQWAKKVYHEAHSMMEFARFAETDLGVYYCRISPIHYVLPLVASHFADRFMNQAWVIHDIGRRMAAVYNGSYFEMVSTPEGVYTAYAETEEAYQELWKLFFRTVAIQERVNPMLQKNFSPQRYWKYMTEHC